MTAQEDEIALRLATVRARIGAAAGRAGRDPASITLVGVGKKMPAARVAAAVRAGLRDCAENYVQEARDKLPEVARLLGDVPPPRWHLVGRLQRNKAHLAAELFDVLHAVERAELAAELDRRAGRAGRRLEAFLQVSLCGEPQKGGVTADALPALLAACAPLPHLVVVGLMTMPVDDPDPETSRPVFARLRALADDLRSAPGGAGLRWLSMGMSHDFEVAIEEGATHLRVGQAIFGPRTG